MSATKRELLEERWSVLTRNVVRFKGEDEISGVNSRRYRRIDETLDELAAMLVHEVHDNETDSLTAVTDGIWVEIESRLLAWAEMIEEGRDKYRASIEPYVLKDGDPRLEALLKGASA